MAIADEKFMSFTTYRRDGRPVATPVWWVELGDGQYGFWTSSTSGKAKRLAHTARVTVQPSNRRGVVKPGSEPLEGTARVVTGAALEPIREKVVAKYGFQTKLTKPIVTVVSTLRGKRSPYGDAGVIVTLES